MSVSEKQKKILAFPYSKYDALICEGAIRSGKTMFMAIAFFDWAMQNFNGQNFIVMGKTVSSAWRNVIAPYTSLTWCRRKYKVRQSRTEGTVTVRGNGHTNTFYIFGAKDESSYQLIQGITAAGCLIDEVAICVESAVNQALARCSVDGSKYWFNCNPSYPSHWFKVQWVDRAREMNALLIHFELRDNPSLSAKTIARYERQYVGVFRKRYIEGLWAQAEGLIYPMYDEAFEDTPRLNRVREYAVSIDYGTMNAFAALLWANDGDVWHCIKEYRYSGRDEGHQKTDSDYVHDMVAFTRSLPGEPEIIIDPSATSFITALRRCDERSFRIRPANNSVEDGLRDTAVCLQSGLVKFSRECTETRKEFEGYVWDDKALDDRPLKVNDHLMDALRYLVMTKHVYKHDGEYRSIF